MEENTSIKEPRNIQNEILLVGSLYKNPDLYISWGQYIRSKYDFDDSATKFFYDNFELMYKTFSQSVDEMKVNTYMSQDNDRLKEYKKYNLSGNIINKQFQCQYRIYFPFFNLNIISKQNFIFSF